jgi:hypothetical protein
MKVQWSGVAITGGTGKLGWTVVQGGRYGYIARTNFRPRVVNFPSVISSAQKSNYINISKSWKGLTESQQLAWVVAAPITMNGYNYFMQINLNYFRINTTLLSSPPAPGTLAQLVSPVLSNVGTTDMRWTWASVLTGTNTCYINSFIIYNISPGINSPVLSQFRLVDSRAIPVGPLAYVWDYNIRGVRGNIGLAAFGGFKIVDSVTGLQSTMFIQPVLIT